MPGFAFAAAGNRPNVPRLRDAGGSVITTQIVCDGNSLTYGSGTSSPATESWPYQMWASLTSTAGVQLWNFGVAGQTTAQMSSDAVSQIDARYDQAYARNLLCVQEGTNSLQAYLSAASALADFKAYCQARRQRGWYVIALTMIDFTAASVTQQMKDDFNTGIRDSGNLGVYWDAVADVAASQASLTGKYVDNFHLNSSGYAVLAGVVKAVVQPLIA